MNKDLIRQISVVISVVATIVVNGMATALPINNQTTGEISDRFPVYFVPAGYVFSIWGLIYIGLVAYAIFQALPGQRTNPRLRSIGWLFVLSSAANIAWIFLWHYNIFILTIFVMLALLASLIAIYLKLRSAQGPISAAERWSVMIPFSVYLGWITVATIANATTVLYDIGWNGSPLAPQVWAAIMLGAAVIITGLMLYTRRDVAYSLVIIWAAVGIAVKHSADGLVSTSAWVASALVTLLVLAVIFRVLPSGSRPAAV